MGAFELPLRFPGQYFDREFGISQNNKRDYDPSIGRFIEADPLGVVPLQQPRKRLNESFSYVSSTPIVKVDPLGLCPCSSGIWDEDAGFSDWQFSIAFGGYGSLAKVNYTCRSNPGLKCSAKQACLGGGLIVGIGLQWNLIGAAYGAYDSSDLGGWSGAQFAGGFFAFGSQGPWGSNGGNFGVGPGAGGGFAPYVRCLTYNVNCNCPTCPFK